MNSPENRRGFLKKFIPEKDITNDSDLIEDSGGFNKKTIDRRDIMKSLLLIGLTPSLVGCKFNTKENNENNLDQHDKKILNEVVRILDDYDIMESNSFKNTVNELLALDNNIIEKLDEFTALEDSKIRYVSYRALVFLTESQDKELHKKALNVMTGGLDDHEASINGFCAFTCMSFGVKKSIPVMIDKLDPQFRDIIMPAEPAARLPDYAQNSLLMFTDQTFLPDKAVWLTWWEENKNKIVWNKQKLIFEIENE